ncbi:MAG: PIG-L family deacetylase [Chlorobi bacterium]|nr:PIG-L family deacetylase [Chlorobiota bacterium]
MKNSGLVRFAIGLMAMGVVALGQPRILVVQAHPDDETGCAALLFALARYQRATVDICVVTNGEAGYRYSTLAEQLYRLPLTIDSVGRTHLPRIRKQEMLQSADILGVRRVFFLDERDHAYNQSLEETLAVWDTAAVRRRLERIIVEGQYDVAIGLLPTRSTHGGHKAATYLLLSAAARVASGMPVLGVAAGDTLPPLELEPFAATADRAAPLVFDRTSKFGFNSRLDWTAVVRWIAAVHRSQGLMTLGPVAAREYYWLLSPRTAEARRNVERLFSNLAATLDKELPNYSRP